MTIVRLLTEHSQDLTYQDRTDKHSDNINILLGDITKEEIINIIRKKKNTAPGPDDIPYIALQRIPSVMYKILT